MIAFDLVLQVPGRAALAAYARSVGDPASPDYRHFLRADEIGARFGLSEADLARVTDWATAHGLDRDCGLAAALDGRRRRAGGHRRAAVRRHADDYADAAGRSFHAPSGEPRVPAALAGLVVGVDGLDGRPSERAALRGPIAAGPQGGMTPPIIDRVYELEGLRSLGLHGEGQTVAIVSLDTFDKADIAAFDRLAGTSGPAVKRIAVNGGVDSPGDGQDEVSLDIDVIRAVAPKAQILDYEAPNEGGAIADVIDRIVKDGRADIVSISWGSCEPTGRRVRWTASRARWRQRRQPGSASSWPAATTAPTTASTATGPTCALRGLAGQRRQRDRRRRHVPVDARGRDVDRRGRLGGAAHRLGAGRRAERRQRATAWQSGPGVDNARSNGKRQVPDVAAAADPVSGFLTVSAGDHGSGGGTSAAAPFWAGFAVLTRQLADRVA